MMGIYFSMKSCSRGLMVFGGKVGVRSRNGWRFRPVDVFIVVIWPTSHNKLLTILTSEQRRCCYVQIVVVLFYFDVSLLVSIEGIIKFRVIKKGIKSYSGELSSIGIRIPIFQHFGRFLFTKAAIVLKEGDILLCEGFDGSMSFRTRLIAEKARLIFENQNVSALL